MPRKAVLGSLAAVAAAYLAYPYATLCALQLSLQHDSPAVMTPLVSWDAVREGIKEDICDGFADDPPEAAPTGIAPAGTAEAATTAPTEAGAEATASNPLPPFGYSFIRGIAENMIDDAVTPARVTALLRGIGDGGAMRVDWAFFDGPREFVLELRPVGAPADAKPMRLRLDLSDGLWRVTRAWLPRWMLERAVAART